MLKVTENKGFHLELTNGAWISVQFGSMNYCQRRSFNAAFGSEKALDVVESIDAEIMICNSHGYHILTILLVAVVIRWRGTFPPIK